ncbi:Pycsar system effector family protein [Erythrobacter sp.]|uniref:Pycsar system effector family protein n=1 Tax=Erythrobacter sp. TaxID=1042 RepID=UPI002E9F55B9|nr:Pycsar system effector family protein [Erythrobacter sp.]
MLLVKYGTGWQSDAGCSSGAMHVNQANSSEKTGGDEESCTESRQSRSDPGSDHMLVAPEQWPASAIHLLRTTQINTLTLSQMADQKANIMIGATFVVFSLSVTRLTGEAITLATLCLAATALLSSLCAVIAVLPTFGAPPRQDEQFNLLFFGHFASLDEEQWKARLMEELGRDSAVFETMMHDIYQNGRVLHRRKYRFLAYGYRIFLGGLLLTMLVFAWEYSSEASATV